MGERSKSLTHAMGYSYQNVLHKVLMYLYVCMYACMLCVQVCDRKALHML
jgi:hypothetical protein